MHQVRDDAIEMQPRMGETERRGEPTAPPKGMGAHQCTAACKRSKTLRISARLLPTNAR